jgi:hypothetical protein
VRKLHSDFKSKEDPAMVVKQIKGLRKRINLIKYMQGLGVFSFLNCVVTMYCIYSNWVSIAKFVFALSLLSLLTSLIISLIEIIKSTNALELELSDIEDEEKNVFSELWNKAKGH